jgi:dipeptidase E
MEEEMSTCGLRRLLLISNSTLYSAGYLDHAEGEIRDLVGSKGRVLFVPYALYDRRSYVNKAQERLLRMGLSLMSIHDVSNAARAAEQADAIFIGGGNTFRLLKALHDHGLVDPVRRRVAGGMPYIGSSAGLLWLVRA